jgi:serine/threonine protein kinase
MKCNLSYAPISFTQMQSSYLVQELMEADLHQIIRSGQPLTDAHFQYFVYQICRGLKYIHSANVRAFLYIKLISLLNIQIF